MGREIDSTQESIIQLSINPSRHCNLDNKSELNLSPSRSRKQHWMQPFIIIHFWFKQDFWYSSLRKGRRESVSWTGKCTRRYNTSFREWQCSWMTFFIASQRVEDISYGKRERSRSSCVKKTCCSGIEREGRSDDNNIGNISKKRVFLKDKLWFHFSKKRELWKTEGEKRERDWSGIVRRIRFSVKHKATSCEVLICSNVISVVCLGSFFEDGSFCSNE